MERQYAHRLIIDIREASKGAYDNDLWASADHFFTTWSSQDVLYYEPVGGLGSGLLGSIVGDIFNKTYSFMKGVGLPVGRDRPDIPPSELTWLQYRWGTRGAWAALWYSTDLWPTSPEWQSFLRWLDD